MTPPGAVLITGASGSVGRALSALLPDAICTDIDTMDVTDAEQVEDVLAEHEPDVIFHLAGAKHAPEGEQDPWHVLNVNAVGTKNVLDHACGAKVILASTCKAADPETAYGASKLIAERMVLNAGGVVCRFYNIPESAGNVFRLWESIPVDRPIPWTDCWRYFVPMDKSVRLLASLADAPSGRYAPIPPAAWNMLNLATDMYPGRKLVQVPPRRGDRRKEPFAAACEKFTFGMDRLVITSPHDP